MNELNTVETVVENAVENVATNIEQTVADIAPALVGDIKTEMALPHELAGNVSRIVNGIFEQFKKDLKEEEINLVTPYVVKVNSYLTHLELILTPVKVSE